MKILLFVTILQLCAAQDPVRKKIKISLNAGQCDESNGECLDERRLHDLLKNSGDEIKKLVKEKLRQRLGKDECGPTPSPDTTEASTDVKHWTSRMTFSQSSTLSDSTATSKVTTPVPTTGVTTITTEATTTTTEATTTTKNAVATTSSTPTKTEPTTQKINTQTTKITNKITQTEESKECDYYKASTTEHVIDENCCDVCENEHGQYEQTAFTTKGIKATIRLFRQSPRLPLCVHVLCDCNDSSLIFMRVDNSTYLNKTWNEYLEGFGKLNGNYWLGFRYLLRYRKQLTQFSRYKLVGWIKHLNGTNEQFEDDEFLNVMFNEDSSDASHGSDIGNTYPMSEHKTTPLTTLETVIECTANGFLSEWSRECLDFNIEYMYNYTKYFKTTELRLKPHNCLSTNG